jgi:hypothetical protein
MLLLTILQAAYPCAGLFHEEGQLAESDAQHAIFTQNSSTTTVEYLVQYSGTAEDFGWVIPIFGTFQSLGDGSSARFNDLLSMTQPKVVWDYGAEEGLPPESGCSCRKDGFSKAVSGDFLSDTGGSSVDVITEGFTGTYEYSVLDADDGEALSAWLEDNGWSIGTTGPSLDSYAQEDGVYFVAIGLQNEDSVHEGYLPPLEITYEGNDLRYPSIMGRYADVEEMRTIVFLEGPQKATVSGWTSVFEEALYGSLSDSPEEVFRNWLLENGGLTPRFGLVTALLNGTTWVTRYESISYPEANTIDATFAFDGGDDLNADSGMVHIYLSDQEQGWFLFTFLCIGAYSRRRSHI